MGWLRGGFDLWSSAKLDSTHVMNIPCRHSLSMSEGLLSLLGKIVIKEVFGYALTK